jgi:mRNA-degrading endonuclease toxin of MazEF toxin-antitoxin module
VPNPLIWLLLIIAAAVALVVLIRRHAGRPVLRATPPDESWRDYPQPGEIWWAEVPFHEATGAKVRPCLVLRTHRARIDVLKITSQDRSARRDHIAIATRAWDRHAEQDSYLDLSDPYRVRTAAFRRRAGQVDDDTWRIVRASHTTGWVA